MSNRTDGLYDFAGGRFGALSFHGPDSAKFLQGQLSADVEKLAPGQSTLAGFHNPQGRVIALLAIVRASDETFHALLPRELLDPVAQRLRKFILRARVRIDTPGPSLQVYGMQAGSRPDDTLKIDWADRELVLVPEGHVLFDAPRADPAHWDLADVRAGMPQVFAPTSESFVAQMLNLDLLGAIAFDKGCYTGQEVIARAHYRGRVKRRMQRWLNRSDVQLGPGDTAHATDGRSLSVVRVAADGPGRQELLAIGTFGVALEPPQEPPTQGGVIVEGPLPLPYALPE